jgi:hypothetical protein
VINTEWSADNSALAKSIEQHGPDTSTDFVKTVIWLSQRYEMESAITTPAKKGKS